MEIELHLSGTETVRGSKFRKRKLRDMPICNRNVTVTVQVLHVSTPGTTPESCKRERKFNCTIWVNSGLKLIYKQLRMTSMTDF